MVPSSYKENMCSFRGTDSDYAEYCDEEDDYSHSVEDNYCISPSTAAQFTWTKEKNMNLAAYVGQEEVINEEEETEEDISQSGLDSFNDSSKALQLGLSEIDQAKLNSCLDEARNILGESVAESVMTSVIIQNKYNLEASINQLLAQQDAPKPQREPRQRKNRSQDDIDTLDLDNLLLEIEGGEKSSVPNLGCGQFETDANPNKAHNRDTNTQYCLLKSPLADTKVNIPSKANGPKISNCQSISLSDLVKQHQKGDLKNVSPNTAGKGSTELKKEPNNLAELASLHSKGGKLVNNIIPSGVFPSSGTTSRITSLSDLVAEHSTGEDSKKVLSLNSSSSSSLGSLSRATVKNTAGSPSSLSLSEMVKLHSLSQTEKSKTNLNSPFSGSTLPSVKNELQLNSSMQRMSLGKSKSQEAVAISRSPSAAPVLPDSFSLASCLKPKKSPLTTMKSAQSKPAKENKISVINERLPDQVKENEQPGLRISSTLQKADAKLLTNASSFGSVLCGLYRKRRRCQNSLPLYSHKQVKYSNFSCKAQLNNVPMYTRVELHHIQPFDFSTPSPDDVVQSRQRQAFTRSDKEFSI